MRTDTDGVHEVLLILRIDAVNEDFPDTSMGRIGRARKKWPKASHGKGGIFKEIVDFVRYQCRV
jgi:hypothetical protein